MNSEQKLIIRDRLNYRMTDIKGNPKDFNDNYTACTNLYMEIGYSRNNFVRGMFGTSLSDNDVFVNDFMIKYCIRFIRNKMYDSEIYNLYAHFFKLDL